LLPVRHNAVFFGIIGPSGMSRLGTEHVIVATTADPMAILITRFVRDDRKTPGLGA